MKLLAYTTRYCGPVFFCNEDGTVTEQCFYLFRRPFVIDDVRDRKFYHRFVWPRRPNGGIMNDVVSCRTRWRASRMETLNGIGQQTRVFIIVLYHGQTNIKRKNTVFSTKLVSNHVCFFRTRIANYCFVTYLCRLLSTQDGQHMCVCDTNCSIWLAVKTKVSEKAMKIKPL